MASRSCLGASSRQTVRQTFCSSSSYSTGGAGSPGLPRKRQGSDLIAPLAVDRIVCARMVVREVYLDLAVLALRDR